MQETWVQSWVGKIPWRRKWQPTQIFLLGKSHEQRSLSSVQFSHSVVSDSVAPRTVAQRVPPSMGFSRQEHWRGLPFPLPGDLPNPGIKPTSFKSPSLAGEFFTTVTSWEALMYGYSMCIKYAMSCVYDVCTVCMYRVYV